MADETTYAQVKGSEIIRRHNALVDLFTAAGFEFNGELIFHLQFFTIWLLMTQGHSRDAIREQYDAAWMIAYQMRNGLGGDGSAM